MSIFAIGWGIFCAHQVSSASNFVSAIVSPRFWQIVNPPKYSIFLGFNRVM
jgi:hypothetical protein